MVLSFMNAFSYAALALTLTVECRAQKNFVSALPDLLKEADIVAAAEIDEPSSLAENNRFVLKPLEIFKGNERQTLLIFSSNDSSQKYVLEALKGKRLLVFGAQTPGLANNRYRLLTVNGEGHFPDVAKADARSYRKLIPATRSEPITIQILKEVASLNYLAPTSASRSLLMSGVAIPEARQAFIELMDIYSNSPVKSIWESGVSHLATVNAPRAVQIVDALVEAKDPSAERWLKAIETNWKRSDEPATHPVFLRWLKDIRPELRRAATAIFSKNIEEHPADLYMMAEAMYDSDLTVRRTGMSALLSFAQGMGGHEGLYQVTPWPFRTERIMGFSDSVVNLDADHAKSLQFWRAWWAQNEPKIRLMVAPPTPQPKAAQQ